MSVKKAVQHVVVMANGEVRVPPAGSEVTHGHRSPDEHIKIVMPANKRWLLVEIEVELEEAQSPDLGMKMRS
jgi:hypothetical protein